MFRAALPRKMQITHLAIFIAIMLFVPASLVFAQQNYQPPGLGGALYFAFTTIGGLFTWAGGGILDYAIGTLVLGMGTLLTGNIGVAVDTLWTVIRDLFNILFIFGLIWIGLQTILRIGSSNLQRTLGGLIVAALLINFSLFITKAIIDFSNIAAAQIYNSGFGVATTGVGDNRRASISDTFMDNMQLNSYSANLIETPDGSSMVSDLINVRAIGYGFLIMVLQIIAGFVFLSGGILLIYRFIALVVYMIFSPAMFVGLIFDKFMSYQRKWWQGFFANAFVAPAYLFMLYLSAAIFTGINGTTNAIEVQTFDQAYRANSIVDGTFGIIFFFAVMAGFLIASTMVAKQMGAAGASTVMKVGGYGANTLRGWGKGAAMAPVNFGKRAGQNAGAALYRNAPIVGGKSYEKAEATLKTARAKRAAGEKLTGGEKWAIGYGAVRGAGSLDDRQAQLKKGQEYKPFGGKSFKEKQDASRALVNQNAQQLESRALLASIDSGFNTNEGDSYIEMVDKITSSSPAEISKVLAKLEREGTGDGSKYQAVVRNLTPNQFKKVLDLKEEDFSEDSKNTLRSGRSSSTQAKLTTDKNGVSQNLQVGLKQASVSDLATLDFNSELLANAAYLQGTQLDDMKKDDFFGGPRFEAIKKKHEADLKGMLDADKAAEIVKSRKGSTNIAKLPANILMDQNFMYALEQSGNLTIGLLSQIASSKDIDDTDKTYIGKAARTALTRDKGDLSEELQNFFARGVGQNLNAT